MKKPLPSVRDFVDAARNAQHDSLGIASDPEALMHLANVSRRAFIDEKDILALRDWSAIVEDIANMDVADPMVREWLEIERIRLEKAYRLAADILDSNVLPLVKRLEGQEQFLNEARRVEIVAGFEAAWHTS